MERHELSHRQWTVWLLAALSAPLAHFSGAGWLAVGLAALAILPLTLLAREGWANLGRTACVVEFLWIPVVAGTLLQNSGVYWPATHNEWFVPLILLLLAAVTGTAAAPRAGAVMGLCLAVLYFPVLVGGAAQAEPRWLLPTASGQWSAGLLVTFLLPALSGLWRREKQGRGQTVLACAGAGILLALLTQGILSPAVAAHLPDAFYQTGRSITLGPLSRLEPVIAVAATLGWYTLASLLFSAAVQLARKFDKTEKTAIWTTAALSAAFVLFRVQLPGWILMGLSLILWVLVPGCTPKYKFEKR